MYLLIANSGVLHKNGDVSRVELSIECKEFPPEGQTIPGA